MSNVIFDEARRVFDATFRAIEVEHQRIASTADEAVAIRQRTDALRKNEADLNATVNTLAQRVAQSRKMVEEAEAAARNIMAGARVSANDNVAQAQHDATLVNAAAKAQAEEVIAKASAHADRLVTEAQGKAVSMIDAAESEMTDIRAQTAAASETLASLAKQIGVEKSRLEALKKKQ